MTLVKECAVADSCSTQTHATWSCAYLPHHELESKCTIINIIVIRFIIMLHASVLLGRSPVQSAACHQTSAADSVE